MKSPPPGGPSVEPLPSGLQVRGLRRAFPAVGTVLDGIDLDVRPAEFFSVLGPSGCGKTTLLRILAGLDRADAGEVRGDDSPVLVFQRPLLLPWKTAVENAAFAVECAGRPRAEARREAAALLGRMGLGDALDRFPSQLSQGMRQRVDLARALLVRPRLLLMDEPFAALDVETRAAMHVELLDRCAERGITVLFVSHALDEVVLLSDRIAVLTRRPARVAEIVSVDLPRPRGRDRASRLALGERIEDLRGRVSASV